MATQLYLIHSTDAKWVTQTREALIADLVPNEMRDENLLELFNSSNQPFRLEDVLPEILSELSTIPFLPDSRRVVVVHDLVDLIATGGRPPGGKKENKQAPGAVKRLSPIEIFAAFVEKDLCATQNVLIFSNIIEPERGQQIASSSKLLKIIKPPVGQILKPARREDDPIFLMTDALLRRQAAPCIKHFRSIYREDAKIRIFHAILRNVRLVLQAKVLKMAESKGTARDIIETKYLPADKKLNLYKQHPYVQEKIYGFAPNFNLRELIQAMGALLDINRVLIPSQKDLYAPDVKILFETFIVGFCQRKGA